MFIKIELLLTLIYCVASHRRSGFIFLFFYYNHYLFSLLISHIRQTNFFQNKIDINIDKIDYLHRVLERKKV